MVVKAGKKLFVTTLKAIQEGLEKREKIDKTFSEICDSSFVCNIGEEWLNQLIVVLEYMMYDFPDKKYGSTISWWLFDSTEKIIWWEEDGQKIERDLTTPEALYDYLVERAG